MAVRGDLRFLRLGEIVRLSDVPPMQTVLDYLRIEERSKGTKEGCNEGDCGACTVALGSLKNGKLVYEPVNACILLMAQLDGKELVTVDDLADGDKLHPVQQALVDHHGSQCGFCTPGFVMALFTLYSQGSNPTRQQIVDHVAGNLCRCTGYRPIIDAGVASINGSPLDRWAAKAAATQAMLSALADGDDYLCAYENGFAAAPRSAETLLALVDQHRDAVVVAGATDVGLWITKQLRDIPKLIHIGAVKELHEIYNRGDHVSIGAAVTYADAEKMLGEIDPDIAEVMRRIGSKQVRASGTVGGNIANGSPIGDMPPMLIALGATLILRSKIGKRFMPLDSYFLSYGKQDRMAGELVWSVNVPKLKEGEVFRAYKISKRFDQDISAVMVGMKFMISERMIKSARIAFGGMAGVPKRATAVEQALEDVSLDDPESWSVAISKLDTEFKPLSDMRASAGYRMQVAGNLIYKALLELSGQPRTRVLENRGTA